MGGGHLHVQIDVGPVSAYLDAFADFLITYKPFHYIADMVVDVGVTFDADFWIIHIVSFSYRGLFENKTDFSNSILVVMLVPICTSKVLNSEERLMSISTCSVSTSLTL